MPRHLTSKFPVFFASFYFVLGVAGCSHNDKKEPSANEKATREWNSARSSVLASLATDQYKSGNFDKSRQTVAQALKLTPDSVDLHVLSARLAIEEGQIELAENELKTVRQTAPDYAEGYYLSGVVYQRWQKPETAFEFYQKAASKAPAELAYLLAEAEMLVAMDRLPAALLLLQAKVTYFEHSGTIRDAVGQMLMQSGRYAEAAAMYREAVVLSENDLAIHERYALALYASGEYREALDNLAKLVQNEKYARRGDLFTLLGECQLHLNNSRAARTTFETATQLDAYSSRAWQGLGRSALECGDAKRAVIALTHSIALDQNSSESHLLLGYVRLREDKLPEALASFQKASASDVKDTVSLCMIGYVLEKLGQSGDAMKCYTHALKLKPGDEMASQLMAGINLNDQ